MTVDDRPAQIVSAARRAMADFGARRMTVGDVAKAAGLSRQTVYEYYPSKDEIVRAALAAGARDLVQRGFDSAQESGGAPAERLAVMLTVALDFLRVSPLWATTAKRAELAPFVTLDGGVFLGAGTESLADALGTWWPHAAPGRVQRAAESLARLVVSHGLAPEGGLPEDIGPSLAALLAEGLG